MSNFGRRVGLLRAENSKRRNASGGFVREGEYELYDGKRIKRTH